MSGGHKKGCGGLLPLSVPPGHLLHLPHDNDRHSTVTRGYCDKSLIVTMQMPISIVKLVTNNCKCPWQIVWSVAVSHYLIDTELNPNKSIEILHIVKIASALFYVILSGGSFIFLIVSKLTTR